MILLASFPPTSQRPAWAEQILAVFRRHEAGISSTQAGRSLSSEEVLGMLADDLEAIGFRIERIKHVRTRPAEGEVPGDNVHFDVYHPEWMCCLAIEDGHDWANIDVAEDLVEPLMVSNVDTLCLAVPCAEEPGIGDERRRASEYERTCNLAEAVYGRTRVTLPKRLLIIGY
jgi:hypothetical protein